jgi:hypothetical protein
LEFFKLKKVGRKQALTLEQADDLRAKEALYRKIKRECNPAALAREFHITVGTLRTYCQHGHKRDARESVPARAPISTSSHAAL